MGIEREAAVRKADEFVRQGKIELAIEEYVRLVEDQPGDFGASNTLGDLYARAGDKKRAVAQFTLIADSLRESGFIPKAVALYKKALKVDPGSEHALWQLAQVAIGQELFADATLYLNRLLQRRRDQGNAAGVAECLVQLGGFHAASADTKVAAARAVAGHYTSEQASRLWVDAADALEKGGRAAEALDALFDAAALDPSDVVVRRRITHACADAGQLDRARAVLTLETAGDRPELLFALAQAELAEGREEGAREALRRAVRVAPERQAEAEALLGPLAAAEDDMPLAAPVAVAADWFSDAPAPVVDAAAQSASHPDPGSVPAVPVADAADAAGARWAAAAERASDAADGVDLSELFSDLAGPVEPVSPAIPVGVEPVAEPPGPTEPPPVTAAAAGRPAAGAPPLELPGVGDAALAVAPPMAAEAEAPARARVTQPPVAVPSAAPPAVVPPPLSPVAPQAAAATDAGTVKGADPKTVGAADVKTVESTDAGTIAALEAAAGTPALEFQASAELGRLFLRLGRVPEGISWLERASRAPALVREHGLAVTYELADALERAGDRVRALAVLTDLELDAASYRDVPQRIARLGQGLGEGPDR